MTGGWYLAKISLVDKCTHPFFQNLLLARYMEGCYTNAACLLSSEKWICEKVRVLQPMHPIFPAANLVVLPRKNCFKCTSQRKRGSEWTVRTSLPRAFFFFLFLSTQTILCRGLSYCLLQIQILSIYCSWLLCVVRKLKFAAGPFILANHADIKSLKASKWPLRGPHSALLFCGHCSSGVFSLCLLGIKPLLLPAPASDCHGLFCHPRPTPTGSCSGAEPCHQLELSPPRVTGVCPASWGGGDTYPHTRSWWLCEHRTTFTSQRSSVPPVPRKKDLNNLV